MKKIIQKAAAIHDLSGYGRASLTTVIPILSTMGVQVCPLPTAVLSTQTSGFENYSFIDLTDYMEEHISHWKSLKLDFDCIYSGFLGSVRQIKIVSDFIDYFGTKENLVVVDPVMGDNGILYDSMDKGIISEMRKLIGKADIITPNFTEAAFLLNEEYKKEITLDEAKKWLKKLSDLGSKIVIITSVPLKNEEDKISVLAYEKEKNNFWKVSCRYMPVSYPGTGDAYTSVVVGSLMQGDNLPAAIDKGMQFISHCIKSSYGFMYPQREGVLLEKNLPLLNMPVFNASYELINNK